MVENREKDDIENKVYLMVDGPFLHMAGRHQQGTFYAVILPSLRKLQACFDQALDEHHGGGNQLAMEPYGKKKLGEDFRLWKVDFDQEDECGICLEPCTKMVLPNCCYSMCTKCYRNWSTKSESCPFCRGSLKRVKSEDLWVLTCSQDVVDAETISKEDLQPLQLG